MNGHQIITETFSPGTAEKAAAIKLWNQEYPAQLRFSAAGDFDLYLESLGAQRHLFCHLNNTIAGWAFAFTRENKRWFALIVSSAFHKKGIGSLLLDQLRIKEDELYGWVVDHNQYLRSDGSLYPSPLTFYTRRGFETGRVRLETDKLSAIQIHWKRNVSIYR